MSVAPVSKVSILLYKETKDKFLEELQNEGTLHISNMKESPFAEEFPELVPDENYVDSDLESLVRNLESSIEFLEPADPNKSPLSGFIELRIVLPPSEYADTVSSFKREELDEIINLRDEIIDTKSAIESTANEIEKIKVWENLEAKVEDLGRFEKYISELVVFNYVEEDTLIKLFDGLPIDYQIVFVETSKIGCHIVYLNEDEKEITDAFSQLDFEIVDLPIKNGLVSENISSLRSKGEKLNGRFGLLQKSYEERGNLRKRFLVLYDYFNTLLQRKKLPENFLKSNYVFIINGWIEDEHKKEFEKFLNNFDDIDYKWEKPEKDESPPIKLKNPKFGRPFEVITELFGLPRYFEVDPSTFLSPFFAIIFAFCLTDAGYGLVLIAIGFYLLKKIPGGERFLWVLIIGGITTIFTGAITGGWFGNIDSLIPALHNFRYRMMLFDPFKSPLMFFAISILIGVIEIFYGWMIGGIEKFRKKMYLSALGNEFSWIFFWIYIFSLVLILKRLHPSTAKLLLMSMPLLFPMIMIMLFGWPSNTFVKTILKGFYTLYSGFFGFIGDVLSYSRIMALGMVTAGIAMSVNIIITLIRPIPVLGVIIGIFIFIGGHLFSTAINALGAFVHTLRLQYVEFFTKFYEGGGEAFTPFKRSEKYVIVREINQKREV